MSASTTGDDGQLNVLGLPLEPCGTNPMTGFIRDGRCWTSPQDMGSHTICVRMTREFLDFLRDRGNDLITPVPEYGFPASGPATDGAWSRPTGSWPTTRA